MADKNFGRVHKTLGQYAAVPVVILDDARLSDVAVRVATQLSRRINYGAWNTEGRVDMSYPRLAARVGKSRWTVMRAVRELVTLGYLAEPEPLHGRAGMRFWFNTGWNDEDEAGYVDWATSGFVVQEGNISLSAYDASDPYCDAFEFGFPTLDSRDRWVQRAKESLARWSHKLLGSRRLKYPIAKVYVLGILEAVLKARQADDYFTDAGRKRYEARLAALAHSGPSRSDVDVVVRKLERIFGSGSADATTTITSGPSAVTARVLSMMAKVAEPTLAVAPPLLPSSAEATTW
jgi:hypothetical protein